MRTRNGKWIGRAVIAASMVLGACRSAPKQEASASAARSAAPNAQSAEVPAEDRAQNKARAGEGEHDSPGLGLTGRGPGGGGAREPSLGLGTMPGAKGVGNAPPAPPLATGAGFGSAGDKTKPSAPVPRREATQPTQPTEAPIDPNGRFATTYRPGGGHLAAFESAVASGIIPEAEREVVADLGARYWSAIDEPQGKALAIRTEFERAAMQPSGGPVHLRVSLRSTAKQPASRPHLSVHLVLDISGSMAGSPMDQARAAAHALVERLAPTDDFSLVTFSSDAQVRVKDGPAGSRRATINKAIDEIHEGGGTNVGAGLQLAYTEAAARSIPEDAVRVVLLLSDGRANSGIIDRGQLARLALDAFQSGVQTSTFGLGSDYDGPLMSGIAADGAGGYYYLRDSAQISPALATELDKRLDPVATAVEVRIRLKPDVSLLRAYGSRRLTQEEAETVRAIEVASDSHTEKHDGIKRDRQNDLAGGMRFFIPAFARDDNHAMLLKLNVPASVGSKVIAEVELKYKDRVARKNVTEELRVPLAYANSDEESARTLQPTVARTVQGFQAGEALMDASSRIAQGDMQGAVALLTEREQILRQAAELLQEPGFLRDADRLARLRGHVGSTGPASETLVLAMLLETAGRTHLH